MVSKIDTVVPSLSLKEVYELARKEILNKDSSNVSFWDILKDSINKIDNDFSQADKAVKDYLLGKTELHDVLITVEKVNLEFRLAVQIHNKLIEAYQEIMRMQI
ncbi:MAG: flagellar hook-basal body complex protein FliE [Candidatus Omnitrophica bacterium]|nr:flagellar hook-basal body complex protein FliE [Candidatus Omnitrophota bacterium]